MHKLQNIKEEIYILVPEILIVIALLILRRVVIVFELLVRQYFRPAYILFS